MTIDARDVRFFQIDGYRLTGTAYTRTSSNPRAGIVFCHGWGGTRGIMAPEIARGLLERDDYAVLTFDFSGFGDSEGPRGRIDPGRQVRDCRAATTWLLSEWPHLRSSVGIFGLSFGGAVGVATAATDRRLSALVTVGSFSDGEEWLEGLRPYWQWVEMRREIDEDAASYVRSGTSKPVSPDWIFPRDPDAAAFNAKLLEEHPERRFELDVASAGLIAELKPLRDAADMAGRVAAMFIHGSEDVTASPRHSAVLAETTGGRFELFEGVGHYDMYEPENFERMVDVTESWFADHLLGNGGQGVP